MNTSTRPHDADTDLNHLRRGNSYRLVTARGHIIDGEYLGIEVVYDIWCLLVKAPERTHSIPTADVRRIEATLQAA